jgi:hypothetical protein
MEIEQPKFYSHQIPGKKFIQDKNIQLLPELK